MIRGGFGTGMVRSTEPCPRDVLEWAALNSIDPLLNIHLFQGNGHPS